MFVHSFVLLSLFGFSSAISCNSLTASDPEEGTSTYPTDVCFIRGSPESGSWKSVCANGAAAMLSFTTNDCSGASTTVNLCSGLHLGSSCSTTFTCDSTPCKYALFEAWFEVTACSGDTAVDGTHSTRPILVGTNEGSCTLSGSGSKIRACSLEGVYTESRYSEKDCSGTPTTTIINKTCTAGYASRFTCNLVASDATTAEPTSVTQDPTGNPTMTQLTTSPTEPVTRNPTTSSCNSLTATDPNEGQWTYPIDVCFAGGPSESWKAVCTNGIATMQAFTTDDCSGASTTENLCGDLPDCSTSFTCDSSPCQYALGEVWWYATQCTGGSPYRSFPLLVGRDTSICTLSGLGSMIRTCSAEGVYTEMYYDDDYCNVLEFTIYMQFSCASSTHCSTDRSDWKSHHGSTHSDYDTEHCTIHDGDIDHRRIVI